MRIVCISDTHNHNQRVRVPDGDVLVHAGDMTMSGKTGEVRVALAWIGSLPHKHKVVVAGNHDWIFQRQPREALALVPEGVAYLQDSEVMIDGLRFYGSPWQPAFGYWAFNLPRGEQLRRVWAKIPDDTDVLVTHGPPYGVLDECTCVVTGHIVPVGCRGLKEACERVQPKLHVFGHIHHQHGILKHSYGLSVNASVCTDEYRPNNAPIVVDV